MRQLTSVHLSLRQFDEAKRLLWRLCDERTGTKAKAGQDEAAVVETVKTMASIVSVMRVAGLRSAADTAALDDLVDRYATVVATGAAQAAVIDHPTLIHFVASVARCYVDMQEPQKAVRLIRSQLTFDEAEAVDSAKQEQQPGMQRLTDRRGLRYATAYNFLGIAAYQPPAHVHTDECAHDHGHSHHHHDVASYDWKESRHYWQRALAYCTPLIIALSSPTAAASAELPSSAASSLFTADSVPLHLLRCYSMTQDNVAQALYRADKADEALSVMKESIDLMSSLLPPHHPDIVRSRQQYISVLLTHQPSAAHHQLEELLALDRRELEPELSAVYDALAQRLFTERQWERAARLFQKCIDIREQGGADGRGLHAATDPAHDLITASRYNDLAMCELRLKEYHNAEKHLRTSIRMKERLLGSEHHDLAVSVHNLGTALVGLLRYGEAEQLMHRAWALYEAKFKADATDRTERGGSAGDAQQNEDLLLSILSGHMGQVYGLMERFSESVLRYEDAVERKRRVLGNHPAVTTDLSALAGVLMSSGAYADAVRVYEEVRDMSARLYGAEHVSACVCLHWLSVAEWKAGKKEDAVKHARQAVDLGEHLRASGGAADSETAGAGTVQPQMLDVMRKNLVAQQEQMSTAA